MVQLDTKLPTLREDLKIIETSPAEDGTKRWRLYDPIQNKYFNISIDTFILISKWDSTKTIKEFIDILNEEYYEIDQNTLDIFINFLINNSLCIAKTSKDNKRLVSVFHQSKQGFFKWLIHNYLFIKVPLLKPDKWLGDMLPIVEFFYSKVWILTIFVLGFVGLFLVLRDWEEYISTFSYFFSLEGMVYYFVSLVFVKSMHELGHSFTAKRYGCKVPTMGVALLVMFPVLYTDTTDSWKLKSKEQRLQIVLSGVKAELYLAMIATFLWSFTPDGILKSILFIISTTSWVTSLILNTNPFLRFDGYYALADWSDSENLQPRAFAMARWYVRKKILGYDTTKPEHLTQKKEKFFIYYAITTWIYRFFLFLGIALLVYHFAFKVLGIILFVIEIVWFILLPIYKELLVWWENRQNIKLNTQNIQSLIILAGILCMIFVPWNTKITLPAVLEIKEYTNIYPPQEAKIVSINYKNGDTVKQGEIIIKLQSDSLDLAILKCITQIDKLKLEISKYAGSKEILDNILMLQEDLARKQKELEGYEKIKNNLTITAPFDSKIYLNTSYKVGEWVNPKELLLALYDTSTTKITALCPEDRIKDIDTSHKAYFIPSIAELNNINATINTISEVSIPNLKYPELSSEYGGDIPTRKDGQNKMYSEKAYYQIDATVQDENIILKNRLKGVLIVEGNNKSIADLFFVKIVSVFIRESAF